MLSPTYVNIVNFSYPLGNTPAVCLTQDLTNAEPANVLLLGCGDVRNVLFTTYADGDLDPRQLDITCCDIAPAILARNILLLTLLVDDLGEATEEIIWNVYFHLYLDEAALHLVQAQSTKLHGLSTTIATWHKSKYGKLLRICDRGTLNRLREIWKAYGITDLNETEKKTHVERFRAGIQRAVAFAHQVLGKSYVTTGVRSAAPAISPSLLGLPDLFRRFWDHGTTDGERSDVQRPAIPNPMFATLLTDGLTLHYGTDPLLGFHLATAYIPLASGSPLLPNNRQKPHLHKAVKAARMQFRVWSGSLRKRAAGGNLTLRFFSGDALAFCHSMQNRNATRGNAPANCFRGPYSLEQLILDGEDYGPNGDAPGFFNVIDTSNLVDPLGAINVLVATSPLLDGSLSATLHTESLVKQDKDQKEYIERLLCGNFATLSVLLGLFPIEYWTNATPRSNAEETLMTSFLETKEKGVSLGQMYVKIAWKRSPSAPSVSQVAPNISPIQFDEIELARLLYAVYLKMFEHETMGALFALRDPEKVKLISLPRYHRGSFASLVCFIQKRVIVDWHKVIKTFFGLVERDSNLLVGRISIQELYLQFYLMGLHSASILKPPFDVPSYRKDSSGLLAWKDPPAAVCVTVTIPRSKLKLFTDFEFNDIGTPPLCCILRSSAAYSSKELENKFSALQLTFGTATPLGSRSDSGFKIIVEEDKLGWRGRSPLLVSFYVPTWLLLLEPQGPSIAVAIENNPHSTMTFMMTLGPGLHIYETVLGKVDDIFITKYLPNQANYPLICQFQHANEEICSTSKDAVQTAITANVDINAAQIVAFTGRIDLLVESIKSTLRDGAPVEVLQVSPYIIAVLIGKGVTRYHICFPAPVLVSRSKCRIARKSSYVEVIAPIASPLGENRFVEFISQVLVNGPEPVIWNLPRLNLDRLPIIDTAPSTTTELEWLITHASMTLSARERNIREDSMRESLVPNLAPASDVRVDLKDSLFSMLMHYTGLQAARRSSFFGLSNPTGGGVHVLILVSGLRLDLSGHTVVLDAAVLPLHDSLMPRLGPFLASLVGDGERALCQIKVNDEELHLWKTVILPAAVERCRRGWKHRKTCEYLVEGKIPLSSENGTRLLCSCGQGTLPKNFFSRGITPRHWDDVSKYAIRVAIAPIFSPAYVEPGLDRSAAENLRRATADRGADRCNVCSRTERKAMGTGPSRSSGIAGTPSKLLVCSRCHDVKYCSTECQRADWKAHKPRCISREK